jgi:hypothetical protein
LKAPKKLTDRQRKTMTAGLSSILDLSDQSYSSQQTLFNVKQWEYINDYFDKRLKMNEYALDSIITNTIVIIKNTLESSNDFNAVKNYIGKKKIKNANNTSLTRTLSMIKHIIKGMYTYQKMLCTFSDINYRENAYLRILWYPLLELLFPPSENIRIVTVESRYPPSIKEKKVLYPNAKYIHGFKIDVRLVVEIGKKKKKKKEPDLDIGECAKRNSDSKSIHDEDKLLREAKDVLDGIILNTHARNYRLMSYSIQITGTHCSLSNIELAKNDLYGSKHRHSFNFPSSISDLSELYTTLGHLLQIKKEINIGSDKVLQLGTLPTDAEESFNRPSTSIKKKKKKLA